MPDGQRANHPEARLLRLLRDHHFPEGQCQVEIKTTAGLATRPDWLHESTKVAVYLDGMSRHLHGDEKTAQRDQLIRQMLELDGYKVLVVQSRDLNDPQALRLHLRNIAKAIRRNDLAEMLEAAGVIMPPEVTVEQPSAVETHGTPTGSEPPLIVQAFPAHKAHRAVIRMLRILRFVLVRVPLSLWIRTDGKAGARREQVK